MLKVVELFATERRYCSIKQIIKKKVGIIDLFLSCVSVVGKGGGEVSIGQGKGQKVYRIGNTRDPFNFHHLTENCCPNSFR